MKYIRIENFTEVITGGTPSTQNASYWGGNIPWLNSGELNQRIINSSSNFITPEGLKNSAARMMPIDTVLIALTGATTGKTALLKIKACANQSVTGILPSSNHVPKYLYYYLCSIREKVINQSYGGAQKHISQGFVKRIEIPLPSLDDQKHIVKILDQADALRQKRKQAIGLLDDYLKAVFLEMFGDPVKNPKKWVTKTLQNLTTKLGDGLHGTPKFSEKGEYFFINGNNLENGKIVFKDSTKKVSHEEFEKYKKPLDETSMLVSINGTLGRVAFYCGEKIILGKSACYFNIIQDTLSPTYLFFILNSDLFLKYATEHSTGSTIKNVSLKTMREFAVIFPPLPFQNKFSGIVEKTELIKQKMLVQTDELETQFQALMQKVFNPVS